MLDFRFWISGLISSKVLWWKDPEDVQPDNPESKIQNEFL